MTTNVAPLELKPRYTHDCTRCVLLGHHEACDLYFCGKQHEPTLVARFSSEGQDYSSGTCFSYGAIGPLAEARSLAQAKGLMTYNLTEALHAMRADAPPRFQQELQEELCNSNLGKALLALAKNEPEGALLVKTWLEDKTAQYQAQFPDKDPDDLRGWACNIVVNAHTWLRRLNLPHVHEMQLSRVIYS